MLKCRRSGGFTLIEMLVVVAIIGILVGLLLPAVAQVRRRALIVKARAEVKFLETALRCYYAEYDAWPPEAASGQAFSITKEMTVMLEGGSENNNRKIIFMNFAKKVSDIPCVPWTKVESSPTDADFYWCKVDHDFDNKIPGAGGDYNQPEADEKRPVIVWCVNPWGTDDKKIIGSWLLK